MEETMNRLCLFVGSALVSVCIALCSVSIVPADLIVGPFEDYEKSICENKGATTSTNTTSDPALPVVGAKYTIVSRYTYDWPDDVCKTCGCTEPCTHDDCDCTLGNIMGPCSYTQDTVTVLYIIADNGGLLTFTTESGPTIKPPNIKKNSRKACF
jgi:hypothetical protein